MSRRTKAIAAFIIVIVVGYGIYLFFQAQNKVPADFTTARQQGAIIAEAIVATSNSSTAQLAEINADDQKGDYKDALTLTNQLVSQSTDLRNQAVNLSAQVGDMTKDLSNINSFDAQQAALESISAQLALINELITYSNDIANLSNVLQERFQGTPESDTTVQGIVNQINTDVNAINNFNTQAQQAMAKFDSIEK